MKKFAFTILAAIGLFLFTGTDSNAGVHVGFYFVGPGYSYFPPAPYYGYRNYNVYGAYYPNHYRYYRHY